MVLACGIPPEFGGGVVYIISRKLGTFHRMPYGTLESILHGYVRDSNNYLYACQSPQNNNEINRCCPCPTLKEFKEQQRNILLIMSVRTLMT